MSDENLISKQLNDGELVEVALATRLNAHAIRLKRDHGGTWGEHPEFPVEDWGVEATNNDTRLGYWEWVVIKLEEGD